MGPLEAVIDASFYLSVLSFFVVLIFVAVGYLRPKQSLTVEQLKELVAEQIESNERLVGRNNDCQEEITKLQQQVRHLRNDQGMLERARDVETAVIEDLKNQLMALTAKIENQKTETDEILDVSYLMLQWIKAAIIKFEGLNEDPPPLDRDILLFDEKYKGRFSKGDNDNEAS